jgi:hypothetical protein
MKRTLLLICTLFCANVLFAQEQLATLKHNGNISVYYGANAFVEAHNAASNGDTINLSDGNFNSVTVIKSLVVRGSGANADTARQSDGTRFNNAFKVQPSADTSYFEAEGIAFRGTFSIGDGTSSFNRDKGRFKFTKCIIQSLNTYHKELFVSNSIITSAQMNNTAENPARFYNCILNTTPKNSYCDNCIISTSSHIESSNPFNFNNCVIIRNNTTQTDFSFANAYNSIICGFTTSFGTNNTFMNVTDVFETWNGTFYSIGNNNFATWAFNLDTFKLKENVANTILGNDGTQVGIFGGTAPFDYTPYYNVIKRLNVSQRTNAEGMLGIEVELMD